MVTYSVSVKQLVRGRPYICLMKVEAASSFEVSANLYQTTVHGVVCGRHSWALQVSLLFRPFLYSLMSV